MSCPGSTWAGTRPYVVGCRDNTKASRKGRFVNGIFFMEYYYALLGHRIYIYMIYMFIFDIYMIYIYMIYIYIYVMYIYIYVIYIYDIYIYIIYIYIWIIWSIWDMEIVGVFNIAHWNILSNTGIWILFNWYLNWWFISCILGDMEYLISVVSIPFGFMGFLLIGWEPFQQSLYVPFLKVSCLVKCIRSQKQLHQLKDLAGEMRTNQQSAVRVPMEVVGIWAWVKSCHVLQFWRDEHPCASIRSCFDANRRAPVYLFQSQYDGICICSTCLLMFSKKTLGIAKSFLWGGFMSVGSSCPHTFRRQ